jgi:hypothetical protein
MAFLSRHFLTCSHCKLRPNDAGKGGLWSGLMLYMKKIVVAASPHPNRAIPPALPPIVNKVEALLARWPQPTPPPPPPTTSADGTITFAASAFTSKNKSAPAFTIKSFTEGVQLLSGGCTSSVGPPCFNPQSSSVTYNVTSASAGTFFLTSNFSTWHMYGARFSDRICTLEDVIGSHACSLEALPCV